MTLRKIIWCWLWHRHSKWPRARKCRTCGLYYRDGAAAPRLYAKGQKDSQS